MMRKEEGQIKKGKVIKIEKKDRSREVRIMIEQGVLYAKEDTFKLKLLSVDGDNCVSSFHHWNVKNLHTNTM